MNIHPKVQAAGVAGALTSVIVFFLSTVGIVIPADVAAGFATVVAFVAGYFVSA